MKAAAAVIALAGLWAVAVPAPASAKAPLACTAFMANFTAASQGHQVTFERPINITRGFGGDDGDLDVRVLSTGHDEVEGTLKCKGDQFRRFEVRIGLPASDEVIATFKLYQLATLAAAFGWDAAKTQLIVNSMNGDAADYLHASIQRGDTYISGKVEYHQGDALDLGVIWTEAERTLVVTTQSGG